MTTRRRISTTERVKIFQRHDGTCHLCGGKIGPGEAWDVSHDIPLELGGADDDTNRKPAHRKCHRDHTAKVDAPTIAKAKRREAVNMGAKAPAKAKIPAPPKPAPKERRFDRTPLPPRPMFVKGADA